jgi:hypothetical protein
MAERNGSRALGAIPAISPPERRFRKRNRIVLPTGSAFVFRSITAVVHDLLADTGITPPPGHATLARIIPG